MRTSSNASQASVLPACADRAREGSDHTHGQRMPAAHHGAARVRATTCMGSVCERRPASGGDRVGASGAALGEGRLRRA